MAISQRTPTVGTAASGAGFSITLPTSTAVGDYLVLAVANAGTAGPNAPTGWTKAGTYSAGTVQSVSIFHGPYYAALTLAFTNAASVAAWTCNSFFEASRTLQLDGIPVAAHNTTNNTTMTTGQPVTGPVAGDYEVLVYAWTSAATLTAATGMTRDGGTVNGTAVGVAIGHHNTIPLGANVTPTAFAPTLSASNTRKTGVGLLLKYKTLAGTSAGKATTAAGGGGTIAQIASLAESPGTSHGFTTSALDTTGANLFLIGVGGINGPWTLTDSKGFTYAQATYVDGSGFGNTRGNALYYATGTGGPGHTFTIAGTSNFTALCVAAYSNAAASPLGSPNSFVANGSSTTSAPGSLTPDAPNSMVVTTQGGQDGQATASTISAGFSAVLAVPNGGGRQMSYLAYQLQTTAAIATPVWTLPAAVANWSTVAFFKAGPQGPGLTVSRTLTGTSTGTATASGTLTKAVPTGPKIDLTGTSRGCARVGKPFVWGTSKWGAPDSLWGTVGPTILTAGPPAAGPKDLTGQSTGLSTASATLTRKRALSGTAPGLATTTGLVTRSRVLTGLAGGLSTASGQLSRKRSLTGTATGLATAAGQLRRTRSLTGTAQGRAVTTGVVDIAGSVYRALFGTAAGTSTVTGLLSRSRVLTATATGVATASGQLLRRRSLTGQATGLSTTTGSLKAKRSLTGTATGKATTQGFVDLAGSVFRALIGTATGTSTTAGQLTRKRRLSATATGLSTVTGFLTRQRRLAGLATGVATTTASPARTRPLLGLSQGSATVTGSLSVGSSLPATSVIWTGSQFEFGQSGTLVRWAGSEFRADVGTQVIWEDDMFKEFVR